MEQGGGSMPGGIRESELVFLEYIIELYLGLGLSGAYLTTSCKECLGSGGPPQADSVSGFRDSPS